MLAAPQTDGTGELRLCKRAHCLVSLGLGLIGLRGYRGGSKDQAIYQGSRHSAGLCWERDTASIVIVLPGSWGSDGTGHRCRLIHMSSMYLVSNNTFGSLIVPRQGSRCHTYALTKPWEEKEMGCQLRTSPTMVPSWHPSSEAMLFLSSFRLHAVASSVGLASLPELNRPEWSLFPHATVVSVPRRPRSTPGAHNVMNLI
jgi:hypothetical protein